MSTILVFGGYGGFGARLSRRLAEAGHDVVVAGRRLARAEAFCAAHPPCRPLQADRSGAVAPLLERVRPDLVIDAAGPFQGSGYALPRACIAAAIPYLDLADGRAFVTGIGRLDAAARAAGVAILSGASSVPALSGAVARRLAQGMDVVTAVEIAISASNRATAGTSVAAAILSYVGRPIRLWRGQRWSVGVGWQALRRERFALSDGASLGRRWLALADVPDLDLLPDRLPGRPAVSFRAGTELAVQTIGLWCASWPVRWGWIPSLQGLARGLLLAQRLTARWGSDRSGMVVRMFGTAAGRRVERRWTLLAADGHGPEIPVLPAAILAERILDGAIAPGARDAGTALDLSDFEPSFARLSIRHDVRESGQADALYARVLGPRFAELAPRVAALHGVLREAGAHGRAVVRRGRHPVARGLAALLGLPVAGAHDLHVGFSEARGVERWTRAFSGRRFTSAFSEERGCVVERFGPLRFRFDLAPEGGGLRMVLRGWSVARLPLPLALAPRTAAREWEEAGLFRFDVSIALPRVGLVVHYRGWLDTDDRARSRSGFVPGAEPTAPPRSGHPAQGPSRPPGGDPGPVTALPIASSRARAPSRSGHGPEPRHGRV
ncbi:DUF4166 domain-containing protein [Methylobacterium sp. 1030]|uniref:DUF4166 domain-containing protein n=1 Tax=Methylobacterium sp. 1030 TaxID=3156404 RepID=UPI003390B8EC